MKKIILGLFLLGLTACGQLGFLGEATEPVASGSNETQVQIEAPEGNELAEAPTQSTVPLEAFFPRGGDVTHYFSEVGNPAFYLQVFPVHIQGNRVQEQVVAQTPEGPSIATRISELREGQWLQVFARHGRLFDNITDHAQNMHHVVLQEPLIIGSSWEASGSEAGRTSTITGVELVLETPAGQFNHVLQLTSTFNNGDQEISYFAPGHGEIRTEHHSGEFVTVFELSRVSHGALQDELVVFYPNAALTSLSYENRVIERTTNMDHAALISRELGAVIPDLANVRVNSLWLNPAIDAIHIDFGAEFLDINMGATYEHMLLEAIGVTLRVFSGLWHVGLTLDGESYQSGHIYLGPGQFINIG